MNQARTTVDPPQILLTCHSPTTPTDVKTDFLWPKSSFVISQVLYVHLGVLNLQWKSGSNENAHSWAFEAGLGRKNTNSFLGFVHSNHSSIASFFWEHKSSQLRFSLPNRRIRKFLHEAVVAFLVVIFSFFSRQFRSDPGNSCVRWELRRVDGPEVVPLHPTQMWTCRLVSTPLWLALVDFWTPRPWLLYQNSFHFLQSSLQYCLIASCVAHTASLQAALHISVWQIPCRKGWCESHTDGHQQPERQDDDLQILQQYSRYPFPCLNPWKCSWAKWLPHWLLSRANVCRRTNVHTCISLLRHWSCWSYAGH